LFLCVDCSQGRLGRMASWLAITNPVSPAATSGCPPT
jgi:hypothetical protein